MTSPWASGEQWLVTLASDTIVGRPRTVAAATLGEALEAAAVWLDELGVA